MTQDTMTLSQAQAKLNDIPDINFGGCGIAALALYRWMIQQGYTNLCFNFLYRPYESDMLEHNESCIQNGTLARLDVPTHIAIQYGPELIDSESNHANQTFNTSLTQSNITEDALIKLINVSSHWNTYFQRSLYIPVIESLLNVDLSDVK